MAAPKGKERTGSASPSLAKLLPAITVAVALIYAVAAYFLLFMPKLGRIVGGGELDTAQLEMRERDERAYLATIRASGDALKQVNPEQRQRVKNILPSEPDVPGIFVEMDALAKANGMALVSVDTVANDKEASPTGVKTVRVALNIAGGTYKQFYQLLDDMQRSMRLADIQSITFTPGTGSFGVVLFVYYFDDGSGPIAVTP